MKKQAAQHIPALDGIRGIAILMVLLVHFYRRELFHDQGALNMLTGRLAGVGNYGVELFFVLSGFLITGILVDYRCEPGSLIKFYTRRSLRIFPLYFLSLAVVLLILPRFVEFDSGARLIVDHQSWLWTYMMNWPTPGWIWDESKVFAMGHFWSLCVEEHYYLFWPAMVYLLPRKSLPWACVALVGVGLASRWAASVLGSATPPVLEWLTVRKIDGLAIGSLLAIVLRDARLLRFLPTGRAYVWILGIAATLAAVHIGLPRGVNFRILSIVNETAVVVCCGMAVLSAVRADSSGVYHRMLTSGWLVSLGKYSYGLYVIHGMLRPQLLRWYDVTTMPVFPGSWFLYQVSFYLFATLISYGLAVLSYQMIERPFLSLKRFVDYGKPRRKECPVEASA